MIFCVLPDEGAGDLGVDEAVAHDEDVDECLAKRAAVLHLPNSLVGKEFVLFGLSFFVGGLIDLC